MTAASMDRVALERLDRGDLEGAATATIEGYGPEIQRFLLSLGPEETVADDAFAGFCEAVWRGLPAFRREASLRTWCYTLARNARSAVLREPHRRRRRALPTEQLEALVADARTRTVTWRQTQARDALAELRDELPADDRELLALRVDRELAWDDIADILDEPAPRLRQRFRRLKERIRSAALDRGLLGGG